jgi:hypothetical protein
MSLENIGQILLHGAATGFIASRLTPTRVCGEHKSNVGVSLLAITPEQSPHFLPTCDEHQAGDFYRAGFRSIGD